MIRVLVVDDHPVLRAGLEAVLRHEPGFVCAGTAADGAGCEEALRRMHVDVVVLDLHLGDVDGLELCARVRAAAGAPEIVVYTADADSDLRARATTAGAADVVIKDADVGTLFDALRLAARRAGARSVFPH